MYTIYYLECLLYTLFTLLSTTVVYMTYVSYTLHLCMSITYILCVYSAYMYTLIYPYTGLRSVPGAGYTGSSTAAR